jgi:hypothetical protein
MSMHADRRSGFRLLFLFALSLSLGALGVACGRQDLDFADPNGLPVTTGNGGSGAGQSGSTGRAGGTGTAGSPGVAGTPGHAGATGAAGATATGGHSGVAGATGTAGTSGTAGTPGIAGNPGTAGAPMPPPPPPPGRVPCGMSGCAVGVQKCCLDFQTQAQTCIGVNESCSTGASLGCVNTASCGAGAVCCVSTTQSLSTTCQTPLACATSPGLILCSNDGDCPRALGNCCGIGNLRVCRARACRGGGGGGGTPPPRGN